jgi:lon-related putative ATP-dependent protease
MFFKRGQNEPKKDGADVEGKTPSGAGAAANGRGTQPSDLAAAPPHAPLPAAALRKTVDPAALGFSTTADLEPAHDPIGQERALKAIAFGAEMPSHDFNIFVLGPPASGKSSAVKAYLKEKTAEPKPISDWIYVNNFSDPNRPKALRLPCGAATRFEHAMIGVVDELRQTVPAMFESEEYEAQARQINDGFRSGQEEAFEALNKKAEAQNIAILRTPMGITLAPVHEGQVVKPEVFRTLPEEMRKGIEAKIEALQAELGEILQTVPKSDKERREKLVALNREFGTEVVTAALDDVRAAFAGHEQIAAHLDAVSEDMIRNIALFLPDEEEAKQLVKQSVETSRNPKYRRYMVNVVVSNAGDEVCPVPVIEETNPNYGNLIGRIENIAQMGTLLTDFLLLKPGALHRANGGYLLLDVRKLLMVPFAWEALKRAIKAREIRVEQPAEVAGFMSTQTLDPEPIPLDVKVILFGDRQLYYTLAGVDPDFTRLFQVQADFEDAIARTEENYRSYGRLIASIVAEHDLLPVDASGVAGLIEEGARIANDRDKLSVEIGRLADLVREADYWARKSGAAVISRPDLDSAIAHSIERSDRIRDRAQETISRDIVMIETTGEVVGQINGLAVLQIGTFAFGRPNRITARVRLGRGQITDIEREAKLGGALHTKGVMILWGFLSGRFAQDIPLALAATLVFEQSYGGVDGDSASSAELYALLSALSDVPIRQGLAVTGSVNQLGEVQAIGGANEKIEGFFDVCKAAGLTGDQGVLIPKSNEQHLMLRPEVVEACHAGKFHIYAVETIDEGIEILTGVKAGTPNDDGAFPDGSINARVRRRLVEFAEAGRSFAKSGPDDGPAGV